MDAISESKTITGGRLARSKRGAKHLYLRRHLDFPLWAHTATRRWHKNIGGRRRYFGKLDDPDAAMQDYNRQLPYLERGEAVPPKDQEMSGVALSGVVNQWLAVREDRRNAGEIAAGTFADDLDAGRLLVDVLG